MKDSDGAGPAAPTARATLRVVAAVVWRGDAILLTQRPAGGAHPLLWEFPGGKIEPDETAEAAVVREIQEELGVRATPLDRLAVHRHAYPGGPHVEITFVRCMLDDVPFVSHPAVQAWRWVRPADVDLVQVLAGDHAFLRSLGAGEVG